MSRHPSLARLAWLSVAAVVSLGLAAAGGAAQPTLATSSYSTYDPAMLSLPWAKGQVWRLTGGPHNNEGRNALPWSALDFQPKSGGEGPVVAARSGIVLRPCQNMVEIRHADGWLTEYYHLRHITVHAGQTVARGQLLGYTSTASGCGGYATGPHVHFALARNGSFVNIAGHVVGGWLVHDGSQQYLGCLTSDGRRECPLTGLLYNTGLVGAGT